MTAFYSSENDNIPLVEKLIDAQKQILDLMEEQCELKEKLHEAKETKLIVKKTIRHLPNRRIYQYDRS